MGENDQIKDAPFDDPKERQDMRAARLKSERMWTIAAPFVAVSENRRAVLWVFGLIGLVVWFTRPDIYRALKTMLGIG